MNQKKTDDQPTNGHIEFPAELRARLTFKTGAHIVQKSADEIEAQSTWQCCARNGGPACPKEGSAEAMKVAITQDGTAAILCNGHGVALHKEGQARGKRIDTRHTLAEYLATALGDLRDRDKTAERHWRAAQEVASLVDEF